MPARFRAMRQRRDIAEPSSFVVNMLRPLRLFFDAAGPGSALRDTSLGLAWSAEVVENLSSSYFMQLEVMKGKEKSLRRYRQPKKQTGILGNLRMGGGGQDDDPSVADERIEAQIVLDVETLGRQAAALGVDTAKSEAFQRLKQSAAARLGAEG